MSSEPEAEELAQPESALSHEIRDYEKMAREAVSSGELLSAIEVARDGLARFRGDSHVLKQMLALALAQTGALDAARTALDEVRKDAANDVETLCLIGRIYKELWRNAPNREDAAAAIRQSCQFYGDAFAREEAYYPGINLAFTLAASGEREKAAAVAAKVAKLCEKIVAQAEGSVFGRIKAAFGQEQLKPDAATYGWALATLAEAMLIQDKQDEAGRYYRRASDLFQGRWRDLASMRKQAHEILALSKQPTDWLDRCFAFPSVVIFSGHMIDAPGRPQPRFPAESEPQVTDAIRQHLDRINAGFGYSSAASGGDIIFCECLLNRGARVNLVLPCSVDNFKRQSVSPAGPGWERRFHHVLANATNVIFANPPEFTLTAGDPASSAGYVFANRIVTGMAALQARALDLELKALMVWDGRAGDGLGGTSTVIQEWRSRGIEPHIVPVGSAPATGAAPAPAPAATAAASSLEHEIKAMMFMEVANYARIAEREIPQFVAAFKAPLAKIIAALPAPPIASEAAGPAFAFVFDRLPDATRLALDTRDFMRDVKWSEHGLPANLGIRIFLHAGPVYAFNDPVLRRINCMGTHMTRASRIAQVVPPGQIYVSQEFAALCGTERVEKVSFEYLGPLPTSQLFYNTPLYRLEHAAQRA